MGIHDRMKDEIFEKRKSSPSSQPSPEVLNLPPNSRKPRAFSPNSKLRFGGFLKFEFTTGIEYEIALIRGEYNWRKNRAKLRKP